MLEAILQQSTQGPACCAQVWFQKALLRVGFAVVLPVVSQQVKSNWPLFMATYEVVIITVALVRYLMVLLHAVASPV